MPPWLHNYKIYKQISASPLSGGIFSDFYLNKRFKVVVLCSTILLVTGIKNTSKFNSVVTILNMFLLVFIMGLGWFYVDPKNWSPFLPFGFEGYFFQTEKNN